MKVVRKSPNGPDSITKTYDKENPTYKGPRKSGALHDTVQLADSTICEAEIHWFESHGIGRKDFKIKRVIR